MTSNDFAVSTINLTKQFSSSIAVNQLDLHVPKGAFCGFLGRNGAGKTTTLKMLMGLIKPTSGEIYIHGQKQEFGASHDLKIGYVPDVPNFYGYMTGAEFLRLCGDLSGISEPRRSDMVNALLKRVGLDKTKTRISGYSRGMKQRLGIAQAMIHDPEIILMDEPISALDPIGRKDVADIIRGLKGTTVIFSTHILADVEDICDYVVIIEKGKVLSQDTLSDLKQKHADDSLRISFYSEDDCQRFMVQAQTMFDGVHDANIQCTKHDEYTLLVKVSSLNVISSTQKVIDLLHNNHLAVKSMQAHHPSLEDIFYETIGK